MSYTGPYGVITTNMPDIVIGSMRNIIEASRTRP
jgi:hypothetical protein